MEPDLGNEKKTPDPFWDPRHRNVLDLTEVLAYNS